MCLWIDEIEKSFAAAGDGDVDGGVSQRVLGAFLTWMQERKAPCFVAATANDVYRLPPELLRKERFDDIFFVDLPDRAEREAIFTIHPPVQARLRSGTVRHGRVGGADGGVQRRGDRASGDLRALRRPASAGAARHRAHPGEDRRHQASGRPETGGDCRPPGMGAREDGAGLS